MFKAASIPAVRPTWTVRRGRANHLPRILAMARHDSEALGFLPLTAVREYLRRGRVLVVEAPDGPAIGFLVWRSGVGRRQFRRHQAEPLGRHIKLIQVCVDWRMRGVGIGTALVERLVAVSRRRRAAAVTLWCAGDPPVGQFWLNRGFTIEGWQHGGERLMRKLYLFVLPLHAPRRDER